MKEYLLANRNNGIGKSFVPFRSCFYVSYASSEWRNDRVHEPQIPENMGAMFGYKALTGPGDPNGNHVNGPHGSRDTQEPVGPKGPVWTDGPNTPTRPTVTHPFHHQTYQSDTKVPEFDLGTSIRPILFAFRLKQPRIRTELMHKRKNGHTLPDSIKSHSITITLTSYW